MSWDIDLTRTLHHGGSHFLLKVAFCTPVRRLALYGPSGSGKTQTLRMIAGLLRPDAGHVRIGGRSLCDTALCVNLTPQQRRLGHVAQDYALFPHLSVRQNIAYACRPGWLNPPRRLRHPGVERWIEAFGLGAVADHQPHQISGGQRQRTAIARALMNEPTALLLDEPFAALDKGLRRHLRDELADLQRTLALPMLLITHDDEDLVQLADEVVHLHAGQVVQAAEARSDSSMSAA